MDAVLVSDFLRFYMDGDMEMDRAHADCYDGICVQTDGERILFNLPEDYSFAGHTDVFVFDHQYPIEDRNGIKIGDLSLSEKQLPDIPGVAVDRTITGWGGWGKYVGFDVAYYDYVRYDKDEDRDRPQRMVLASVGGYRNPVNPVGGKLKWTGGAVAIDYSDISQNRNLVGDAELTLHLDDYFPGIDYLVRVDITEMEDVETGTAYDDMSWKNIPLREGGFETFSIRGQFFGPGHAEVGGTFERDEIVGAFGAAREE